MNNGRRKCINSRTNVFSFDFRFFGSPILRVVTADPAWQLQGDALAWKRGKKDAAGRREVRNHTHWKGPKAVMIPGAPSTVLAPSSKARSP